jgi:hypothetical protein
VTTVEINTMSMTSWTTLSAVTCAQLAGTSEATSHGAGVRVQAPYSQAVQGTSVSAARFRAAAKATAQLPINDVVVFDGGSGILAWSPPV